MCRDLIFSTAQGTQAWNKLAIIKLFFTNPHTHSQTHQQPKITNKNAWSRRQNKSMIKKKRTHSALLALHSTSEVHSEYPRQWVDLSNNPDGESNLSDSEIYCETIWLPVRRKRSNDPDCKDGSLSCFALSSFPVRRCLPNRHPKKSRTTVPSS